MNIVLIDDEYMASEYLSLIINGLKQGHVLHPFNDPLKAIEYIKSNHTDMVFCDVEMPGINGIEAAERIHQIDPNIRICFTTGYEQYAFSAFKVNACGYLLKPYSEEEVVKEIEKTNKVLSINSNQHVVIRTFGNFDVFVDGKLMNFTRVRAKECLAVLTDRKGGFVSNNEMMAYIFQDEEVTESLKSNYRNIISSLMASLKEYAIEDIIIKIKGGLALDVNKVDCDYFDFLAGSTQAINQFTGEYMTNYSWAEGTLSYLLNRQ